MYQTGTKLQYISKCFRDLQEFFRDDPAVRNRNHTMGLLGIKPRGELAVPVRPDSKLRLITVELR